MARWKDIVRAMASLLWTMIILKVHYCKLGNLPISSSSNENNMSKVSS